MISILSKVHSNEDSSAVAWHQSLPTDQLRRHSAGGVTVDARRQWCIGAFV